jgi:hypothetical protein
METSEKQFKMGLVAALTAFKKTLSMFPEGMTEQEVKDLIDEIDQQLGIKNTEIELLKRA